MIRSILSLAPVSLSKFAPCQGFHRLFTFQSPVSLPGASRTSTLRVNYCTSQSSSDQELDTLYKKLMLEVKAHDPSVLKSYEKFVKLAAQELGVQHVRR